TPLRTPVPHPCHEGRGRELAQSAPLWTKSPQTVFSMIGTCPPGVLWPQCQLPAENCVPASSVAQVQLKRMGDGPVGVTAVSRGRGGRKLSQQHAPGNKTKGEMPERRTLILTTSASIIPTCLPSCSASRLYTSYTAGRPVFHRLKLCWRHPLPAGRS